MQHRQILARYMEQWSLLTAIIYKKKLILTQIIQNQ